MFALMPFGGSVVILMHFWRMDIGNFGWGLVDSQSLKLGDTLPMSNVSNIFSSSFKKFKERWQLAR